VFDVSVFEMLYAAWFMPLLISAMAFGLLFLIVRIRNTEDGYHAFRNIAVLYALLVLLPFYFLMPVPKAVQQNVIHYIHVLKDNNSQVNLSHTSYQIHQSCKKGYLRAFQYFGFLAAYNKDFNATFEQQNGFVNFSEAHSKFEYKEQEICDLKNMI
jgi:hypothetical protein